MLPTIKLSDLKLLFYLSLLLRLTHVINRYQWLLHVALIIVAIGRLRCLIGIDKLLKGTDSFGGHIGGILALGTRTLICEHILGLLFVYFCLCIC